MRRRRSSGGREREGGMCGCKSKAKGEARGRDGLVGRVGLRVGGRQNPQTVFANMFLACFLDCGD